LLGTRNDRKHGKSHILMKHAVDWAMDVCFHLIKAVDRGDSKDDPSGEHQWKKPMPGYLKINTNGAYDVDSLAGGTGAVITNEDGTFVKAISRRLPHVASALVVEAEAWRDGLRLLEPTHQQVILEIDSMELLALWNCRDVQRSEVSPILNEVHAMTQNLSSFRT
jgi:hypothetical protein